MIEHSSHIEFIVAAYVIAAVVIGSMIVVAIADYRGLRRALKRFGERGERG